MRSSPVDADMVIVAFGPVGVTAANVLGRLGVRTIVLTGKFGVLISSRDPRVIFLRNDLGPVLKRIPLVRRHVRLDDLLGARFAECGTRVVVVRPDFFVAASEPTGLLVPSPVQEQPAGAPAA